MPKQNANLNVAFGTPDGAAKGVTVVLKGLDLYTIIHKSRLPIESKHSYHESGATHLKTKILDQDLESRGRRGESLTLLEGYRYVHGGAAPLPVPGNYQIKNDTSNRRTILLPRPNLLWGAEVWAVERGAGDIVKRISETPPWENTPVVGVVLADWTQPMVLVKIWSAVDPEPYLVIKYEPAVPGHVPYIITPAHYEGTWLQGHFGPRPKFEDLIIERAKQDRDGTDQS